MDHISYSLGDAIDWKHRLVRKQSKVMQYLLLARGRDRLETSVPVLEVCFVLQVSYSLGDAIDWKPRRDFSMLFAPLTLSYSLGDAIDWKLYVYRVCVYIPCVLLLARGRDRLETGYPFLPDTFFLQLFSYSLGDAIDWKPSG